MDIAEPIQIAIEQLSKLPTIGKKSAQRLALYLLKCDPSYVKDLTDSISNLKNKVRFCNNCFNITTNEECNICTNPKRDKATICVVEDITDVIAIEKTNEFRGLYHVLGGVLSPLSGVGPNDLHIKELMKRISAGDVKEIILALNPDTEGESTALYMAKIIKPFNIKVSRIARGIPIGGNLEFADEATVGRAVLGRITLE